MVCWRVRGSDFPKAPVSQHLATSSSDIGTASLGLFPRPISFNSPRRVSRTFLKRSNRVSVMRQQVYSFSRQYLENMSDLAINMSDWTSKTNIHTRYGSSVTFIGGYGRQTSEASIRQTVSISSKYHF